MPKKETFTSRFEETRGGRVPQKSKIWGDVVYGWSLMYCVWPLITVHTGAETIQGRKLFKGGNYSRKYGNSILRTYIFLKVEKCQMASLWKKITETNLLNWNKFGVCWIFTTLWFTWNYFLCYSENERDFVAFNKKILKYAFYRHFLIVKIWKTP